MAIINGHRFDTDNQIKKRSRMHGYGTIVREHKTKPGTAMCGGCRDDYYNRAGNSSEGRCWMFKDAKVVDKVGHSTLNTTGGVDTLMEKTLSCWHATIR